MPTPRKQFVSLINSPDITVFLDAYVDWLADKDPLRRTWINI